VFVVDTGVNEKATFVVTDVCAVTAATATERDVTNGVGAFVLCGVKFNRLGIDLDGVVIDSETTFRTYEEIFDIDTLKGNNLINKEEPKFQSRYNWTEDQEKEFYQRIFPKSIKRK